MGVQVRNGGNENKRYFEYVPMLGGIFASERATQDAIAAARQAVGAVQTTTFEGDRGDSASAKALAILKEQGILPVTLDGKWTGAAGINKQLPSGDHLKKILVELTDGDQKIVLATPLNNDGAQMLARKLANATPGEHLKIQMFATRDDKDGRVFTNHGASLKQNGEEVKSDALNKQSFDADTAVKSQMAAAKITDRNVVGQAVRNARIERAWEVVTGIIKPKFGKGEELADHSNDANAAMAADSDTFDASELMPGPRP